MSYKTYKMTIKAKSTFITPIQSDTLFGQMIWAIKYTQNDEMVEKIGRQHQRMKCQGRMMVDRNEKLIETVV